MGDFASRQSRGVSAAHGMFLVVPVDADRFPWKPENCVKRVSPCQECVNKRA